MREYDVVVIGAGAAGMMAAVAAGMDGASVCLIEKNEKPGKKIYITGKGRCNLTNACDTEDLFSHIVTNSKFMYSSIYSFTNFDTIDFFEKLGLKTKIERGNRVFPKSDKSSDVIRSLWDACRSCQAEILFRSPVKGLDIRDDTVTGVCLADGSRIHGRSVIVTTGGKSYPLTGSNGSGYEFAEQAGHTVKPCIPGLVPMNTVEHTPAQMQGLSMKNVRMAFYLENGTKRRKLYEEFGEMMFTHFGLTGPIVLSASSYIGAFLEQGTVTAELDCKPALTKEKLHQRLLRDFESAPNISLKNSLGGLLPKSMVPVVTGLTELDGTKPVNEVRKDERERLVDAVKGMRFTVSSLRGWDEAIITRGGVDVKQIHPSTMESKKIRHLYFAGEVLDVDAQTGGYNLQIAWSTGYAAGKSAAHSI